MGNFYKIKYDDFSNSINEYNYNTILFSKRTIKSYAANGYGFCTSMKGFLHSYLNSNRLKINYYDRWANKYSTIDMANNNVLSFIHSLIIDDNCGKVNFKYFIEDTKNMRIGFYKYL